MKIVPLFLLISGLILLTICIILLVQIVTYKLRKSSLPIYICFIILAVADIVTGISALGGFNHE